MSDHHTRFKAQLAGQEPPRVLGCLLGTHAARTVEICNSFEVTYESVIGGVPQVNLAFLTQKQEQCACSLLRRPSKDAVRTSPPAVDKKVFPKLELVGWYSTGSALVDADLELQRLVRPPLEAPRTPRWVASVPSRLSSHAADERHH